MILLQQYCKIKEIHQWGLHLMKKEILVVSFPSTAILYFL